MHENLFFQTTKRSWGLPWWTLKKWKLCFVFLLSVEIQAPILAKDAPLRTRKAQTIWQEQPSCSDLLFQLTDLFWISNDLFNEESFSKQHVSSQLNTSSRHRTQHLCHHKKHISMNQDVCWSNCLMSSIHVTWKPIEPP